MYNGNLYLCIISASNLWTVEDDADVFVIARLISGTDEPTAPQSTTSVSTIDGNPTWNFPVQFTVSNLTAPSNNLIISLQVRSYHRGLPCYEEEIGQVYLPVDDLLGFETRGSSQYVAYEIRDPSGAPIGELNLSYKFTDDDGDRHRWSTPKPSAPPLLPPHDPPKQPAGRRREREVPVKVAMVVAAAFVASQSGELLAKLQELVVAAVALALAFLVFFGFLISLPDLWRRLGPAQAQRGACWPYCQARSDSSGRSRNQHKPGRKLRGLERKKPMSSQQSIREAANFCLHACLPKPPLPQQEAENPTPSLTSSVAESRRFFVTTTATSFFPSIRFTSHESLPSLEDAYVQFVESYPHYAETFRIDEIRAQDYYHLSVANHVCLDYIGIGLFSFSQFHNQLSLAYPTASTSSAPVQSHSQASDVPLFSLSFRSVNLKSELTNSTHKSRLEAAVKKRIMDFLKISAEDYCVVLTANRTAAFRLLAESYPFQSHRKLLTVYDHQSESVEAMISSSAKRGSQAMTAEFTWPRLRIQSTKLKSMLVGKGKKKKRGLFVFQLQSRMSGARYSYQWMQIAQENGWQVLLDSCALRPKDMDSLGLSLLQPDFLICSFYKVFGEKPSGFGCLFVKKSAISMLEDSTIVGIVTIVPANRFLSPIDESSDTTDTEDAHSTTCDPQEVQVDPSPTFSGPISAPTPQPGPLEEPEISSNSWSAQQSINSASEIEEIEPANLRVSPQHQKPSRKSQTQMEFKCLDQVDSLGLTLINSRGRYLTNWLINALTKLHHPNSERRNPLVKIYGPKIKFERGPALAFNVFDWKGERVEPLLIQKLADRKGISLSHGFLQNLWFPEKYQGEKGRVLEKRRLESSQMGVKVVTAAIGYLANFEDVYRVWVFIAQFLDADFVEKERWRFTALNLKTIEI